MKYRNQRKKKKEKGKKKAANRDETESCSKATERAVSAVTGEHPEDN